MVLENKVLTLPIIFMHLLMLESILLYGPYAAEQEPISSVDGYFHHLLLLTLGLSYKPVYLTILKSEQHSEHSVLQMYVFLTVFIAPCGSYSLHSWEMLILFCYRYGVSYFCICKFMLKGNVLICCGQILFRILKCALQCVIHLLQLGLLL